MPKGIYKRTPEMKTGKYKRTPEHNVANSKAKTGVQLSPEHIAAISKGLKNSDAVKNNADMMRGVPKSSETCAVMSEASRNSDAVKLHNESMRGVPLSPEHIAAIARSRTPEFNSAMSDTITNSDAAKAEQDRQRGGNDIVKHHYIYDHNDLSLNTVQMIRSDHMRLHRLLQKLGYIIPHVNVSDDQSKED